jgi:hypothetical protein
MHGNLTPAARAKRARAIERHVEKGLHKVFNDLEETVNKIVSKKRKS